MENIAKTIGISLFAVLSTAFEAVLPLIILAMLFVVSDCISAFRLSRRISKLKIHKGDKAASGKFKSSKMAKTVLELIVVIPTGLLLAFFTQKYLFGIDVKLPQIFAGIVIFWQIWSILENESSCSDKKWAKILQKIMIDKTERHFDIDLCDLKNTNENETNTKTNE